MNWQHDKRHYKGGNRKLRLQALAKRLKTRMKTKARGRRRQ